jgi:ABC-type transport system involved in multi-copper enzyme maturation permease subunit
MSILQLGLVALLAPIFTAGAITQEKDSQTYDILLTTPLTNAQVLLGSLMSRLFFVIALLISGIPIFSITQIFGGVAIHSIILSFLIAAATATVTGALAMAIATFKVGTRRTIFSFYMFVVIYLVGGYLLDRLDFFHVHLLDPQTGKVSDELSKTSWLTPLHPFLALRAIFHDRTYLPPGLARLPETLRDWPVGWMLSSPTSFYITFMFFLSTILVLPSIALLRRMAQSTVSPKAWVLQKLHISKGDRRRRPRGVWNNPIAWREAKTKASAARASILRYGFIAGGTIGALALVVMFSRREEVTSFISRGSYNPAAQTLFVQDAKKGGASYNLDPTITKIKLNDKDADFSVLTDTYQVKSAPSVQLYGNKRILVNLDLADVPRTLNAKEARNYLLGAVILEFAVILLIVTNTAASTVTREKEDGTLDLLLSTPITSRYYIWGKLRGLVSFMLPLVAVPVASILLFVVYDFMRMAGSNAQGFEWIVFPEAVLILPGTLIIVVAFASILGMMMSLRCRTTVRAVMSSVGIVLGICGALSWCGFSMLNNRVSESGPGLFFGAFSPFTLITILIDPYNYGGRMFRDNDPDQMLTGRIIVMIFSWVATGGYAAIVWAMYKSMVKNFDMTIRKQSR